MTTSTVDTIACRRCAKTWTLRAWCARFDTPHADKLWLAMWTGTVIPHGCPDCEVDRFRYA